MVSEMIDGLNGVLLLQDVLLISTESNLVPPSSDPRRSLSDATWGGRVEGESETGARAGLQVDMHTRTRLAWVVVVSGILSCMEQWWASIWQVLSCRNVFVAVINTSPTTSSNIVRSDIVWYCTTTSELPHTVEMKSKFYSSTWLALLLK